MRADGSAATAKDPPRFVPFCHFLARDATKTLVARHLGCPAVARAAAGVVSTFKLWRAADRGEAIGGPVWEAGTWTASARVRTGGILSLDASGISLLG